MKNLMRPFGSARLRITVFCATALLLAACGSEKTESTVNEEEEDNEISLVGIPKSAISAVCLDSNSNMLCEATEELEYRDDFGASIYQAPRNPPTGKEILVVTSNPAKTNHFDQVTMAFPSDSNELSMQKLIMHTFNKDVVIANNSKSLIDTSEIDLVFFLAHQNNINMLGEQGLSSQEAGEASLEKIGQFMKNLDENEINELKAGKIPPHKPWIEVLSLSNAEAYEAGVQSRAKKGDEKGLVNDKLVESFQCETGQVRTVQHYGIEDVFDLSNGTEQTYPSASILANSSLAASAQMSQAFGGGFVNYDDTHNDRYFADEIKNLPSGIVDGRIYIGFKSNGSSLQHNDAVHIGAYGIQHYGDHLQDLINPVNASSPWEHQLVNTSNPTTDVYWNDFGALNLAGGTIGAAGSGGTLLSYVQTNNSFDVFVQDDTSVDFITVATCSKKDPVVEIKPILEKFQCKAAAGETRHTITRGIVDAYANGSDTATPSSALVNATSAYPTVDYDATAYDKFFIDTLTLPTSGYISSARLSVGVKALNSSLHSNDTIHFGYSNASDKAGFKLFGNATNSVNNQWNVASISNGERIIQTDFNLNMQSGAPALPWLRGESELDIVVQDDTSVDFVQLDLCMLEKAPFVDTDGDGFSDEEEIKEGSDPKDPASTPNDWDGDGVPNEKDCDPRDPSIWEGCEPALPESCNQVVKLDLSPAATWLNASGITPTENNVFDGTVHANVWDPAMTWFDFGSAANTTHDLSIDFCSCGKGEVDITEMKSDNFSKITLDNGSPIVERTVHSQSTMATWGPNVQGDATIPYSGNGVNHTLKFSVENRSGPSGGAVNGLLTFTGHMGKCTAKDVLPK